MNILVIDGQGGRLGKYLCERISEKYPGISLTAVGTNSAATSAMMKGGAKKAATGENSVAVLCKTADVIIGPVGMVIADSLLGEVTPKIALAVARSNAVKIMIPSDKCGNIVAGVQNSTLAEMAEDAIVHLSEIINKTNR